MEHIIGVAFPVKGTIAVPINAISQGVFAGICGCDGKVKGRPLVHRTVVGQLGDGWRYVSNGNIKRVNVFPPVLITGLKRHHNLGRSIRINSGHLFAFNIGLKNALIIEVPGVGQRVKVPGGIFGCTG